MNFPQAVASCFRNYVGFSGRAPRSEYWYWILFYVLVVIAAILIDTAVFRGSSISPLTTIVELACLLPGLAVSIRRLHDIDRSGWWILLALIPLIGAIILLIWDCTKGTPGPNRFGPDPLGGM